MTSTVRPPRNGERDLRAAFRGAAAPSTKPSREFVRRRWARVGTGVAAAVVGAWVFVALYLSAGDQAEVLVLAREVPRLEIIDRADLRAVRISVDANVESVAAGRVDDFVGRTAAVDLLAGSLLAEGQVLPEGRELLGDDEAVVGVLSRPGDTPMRNLRRGSPVLVVVRPPSGSDAEPEEIEGWVFDASGEPLNTRERPLEIAVPRASAGMISAAAADGRVTLVALSE